MKGNGVFSHESDHWATPKKLYECFMKHGYIDPCPLHCKENNLWKTYFNKKLFINPPYSKIKDWVEFIRRNKSSNCEIWLLIPARTDTKYFHELLELSPDIVFLKGRLHFNDETGTAPFPSVMLHFYKLNFCPSYFYVKTIEEFTRKRDIL